MNDVARWLSSLPAEWTQGCDEALFASARECYQSPGRVYHAWGHIADCVEKLRAFPCESGRRVFLALLFHDAVYVVGSPANEEQSAELAVRLLRSHSSVPAEDVAGIAHFIRATKHHRLPPGESNSDLMATLDIDMSILGSSPDAYLAYADGVRREYCPAVTSEARFNVGRLAFLSKVLEQPRIFHSTEGIARWEAPARENIAREVESLEAGQGLFSRIASAVLRWR